jgi:hypothetical protein
MWPPSTPPPLPGAAGPATRSRAAATCGTRAPCDVGAAAPFLLPGDTKPAALGRLPRPHPGPHLSAWGHASNCTREPRPTPSIDTQRLAASAPAARRLPDGCPRAPAQPPEACVYHPPLCLYCPACPWTRVRPAREARRPPPVCRRCTWPPPWPGPSPGPRPGRPRAPPACGTPQLCLLWVPASVVAARPCAPHPKAPLHLCRRAAAAAAAAPLLVCPVTAYDQLSNSLVTIARHFKFKKLNLFFNLIFLPGWVGVAACGLSTHADRQRRQRAQRAVHRRARGGRRLCRRHVGLVGLDWQHPRARGQPQRPRRCVAGLRWEEARAAMGQGVQWWDKSGGSKPECRGPTTKVWREPPGITAAPRARKPPPTSSPVT